jgi:predicted ATPase
MKRYILTGAPGAGKTAILRELELRGYGVVEEAATDVIALWQAKGIAEPWIHSGFLDAVTSLQKDREHRSACYSDAAQFHDRSVVCTAALADYLGFPRPRALMEELQRIKTQDVFERKVIFLRNLGFITPSEARRITFEETVRFEAIHEQVYREFGFEILRIQPGPIADRVNAIEMALGLGRI